MIIVNIKYIQKKQKKNVLFIGRIDDLNDSKKNIHLIMEYNLFL